MTIDTITALEAAETWHTLAKLVPTIRLYLEPTSGTGNVRMPPASKMPISIIATDLLFDLDQAASFYCSALLMETPDTKRIPHSLEAQLALIGTRHGHWTAALDDDQRFGKVRDPKHPRKWLKDDDGAYVRQWRKLGLDYCDEAQDLLAKVINLVVRPLPPMWMGPCQQCGGNLWMYEGRLSATCEACKSNEDAEHIKARLHDTLTAMVVKRTEIAPALRLLGSRATTNTVKAWVQRGRLVPVMRDPEYFRMADALELCRDLRVAA